MKQRFALPTLLLGIAILAVGQSPRESTGLIPLTEMSAKDQYKGEDGGLYGQGRNSPPESHRKAAQAELAKIRPVDAEGKAAKDGRVVLVSISMSNATQEFSVFKRMADVRSEERRVGKECRSGGSG